MIYRLNLYPIIVVSLLVLTLSACQPRTSGRYHQKQDSAPTFNYPQISMLDAVPKYEPYREHNSRPYTVLGKRYYPLATGKGYTEVGVASWYGQKFHGHMTSNGETYNMFSMTAAHKTLPLPSYVKVTNLANNKHVIVRVNDRGPFHDDRIIDLSYAAATKLDYRHIGTAKVKVEVIHFDEQNNVTVGRNPTISHQQYLGIKPIVTTVVADAAPISYIQVASSSDQEVAREQLEQLAERYQLPTELPFIDNTYKLRLGPLTDRFQIQRLLDDLKGNGFADAFVVNPNSAE